MYNGAASLRLSWMVVYYLSESSWVRVIAMSTLDRKNNMEEDMGIQDILSLPSIGDGYACICISVLETNAYRSRFIQEVALSPCPRLVYGHDSMSFEDMANHINKLRPHQRNLDELAIHGVHPYLGQNDKPSTLKKLSRK
jgi:hypothetical protein